jgi:RNA polymerase sigma factor (sigma-70 family)
MTDSRQLLADYAATGSEVAFRELVSRYIDLVYSTASRLVDGDAHRAQDIAQTVFLDLSRQAAKLAGPVMLGGWLHRHTCFVARKAMRGERRRQLRERQAAEMNALNSPDAGFEHLAPVLDEVINELGEEDRKAILLRFYERLDLRSVGEALGASENAAQKRVSRALDQLQVLLTRRGVALSAAALGAALAGQAVSAAPAGLAMGIAGTVLAGGAAGSGTVASLTKILMITKAKLAILGAVLVVAAATPTLVQHQTQVQLRNENASLRQQVAQLSPLQAENERLSNLLGQTGNEQQLPEDQARELLRLRGEVGRLRQENQEVARLREQLRQSPASARGTASGSADALVDYLGTAIAPPANLDPAYTKDGLLNAIQSAAGNAGISLKQVQADDSEFPCLLGVISAPGDWEKLKAQLRKLSGYEYYGAVGNDNYNAFCITPSRAFPPGSSQAIFRRVNVRMQLLADQLNAQVSR